MLSFVELRHEALHETFASFQEVFRLVRDRIFLDADLCETFSVRGCCGVQRLERPTLRSSSLELYSEA